MKLEFIGGSRDGSTLDVPSSLIPNSPLFDGPVYLTPTSHLVHKSVNGVKVDCPEQFYEVYNQSEPGKLLFIGWKV